MSEVEPLPSPISEANALLAAGQLRSGLSSMLRQLHLAVQSFASATGMILPPGDAITIASSILQRAARACTNPSLASHCQRCVALLEAAWPHVTDKVTAIGAGIACKAVTTSLGVLRSADTAKHVKAGATMHLASGHDVLSLQAESPAAVPGRRRLDWPMDPFLATCLFCMLGLVWSALGLLASMLTITQGAICCCWFMAMYVAWKSRGWARVKVAIARWRSLALIRARTCIIAGVLVAALLLPMTNKHLVYAPAGTDISEPSSLLAIIVDQHPTSGMLVLDLAAAVAIGSCGVAIIAGIRARHGGDQAKAASFHLWRSLAGIAAMVSWIAVLSWLVAERVYFPGTTLLVDAESLSRVEIGWGWLAFGLLGILDA